MRLDSPIILRIEWNSYVSYLRGKQWKYWRLKLYNLRCVLCCVVLCCVLSCVLSVVVVAVVVVVVGRRRRPPSVRPSRQSVAVVRRRRPLSVRPVRPVRPVPSVRRRPSSSTTCKSKAACNFFEKESKYESYSHGTVKFRIYETNAADSLGQVWKRYPESMFCEWPTFP